MKPIINFTHLKKLLTCQRYLVWHDLKKPINILNDEYRDFEFELPSFIDSYEHSLSEIQAKTANIIQTKFLNKMHQKFQNLKIIPQGEWESKAQITKQHLEQNNLNVIYNPTFVYEYQNFAVLANPSVYDPATGSVYFLKMSTNTKRGDMIKLFFDIEVMKKLHIDIKHVYLYIIATKKYKKGEVDFFATEYLNNQKNGPSYKNKDESNYYINAQILKAGINNNNGYHILTTINNKQITSNFQFHDLDNYLQEILYAKDVDELQPICEQDNQFLDDCYVPWKTIVNIKNDHIYHDFNGKIIKKQDIIDQIPITDLIQDRPLLQKIINHKNQIIVNEQKIKQICKNIDQSFVVWYDFEAFSLPIAPMDNFLPFHQVVSQVSIIKTIKMVEQSVVNIVLDPQIINYKDFEYIVNSIYDQKADYYIVYNASYEHSRLNDIVQKMHEISYKNVESVAFKVRVIIKNTIDLADLFMVNSSSKIPPLLITDLKGMYSIKQLEKYITSRKKNFHYQIKKYEDLTINNGLYAMETTNNRALNIIGDKEWKNKVKQLAEYCENDVRAMIMVYYFVQSLINK